MCSWQVAVPRKGAVRLAVDHQRARTADAFTAVVVERDGFQPLTDELLVEHVEHLQERGLVADAVDAVALEVPGVGLAVLPPDLEGEVFQMVTHL
jgi:hypothetical protein